MYTCTLKGLESVEESWGDDPDDISSTRQLKLYALQEGSGGERRLSSLETCRAQNASRGDAVLEGAEGIENAHTHSQTHENTAPRRERQTPREGGGGGKPPLLHNKMCKLLPISRVFGGLRLKLEEMNSYECHALPLPTHTSGEGGCAV